MDTTRVGKNIVLALNNQYNLYIHLMMTGKLLWNYSKLRERHIRFSMELNGKNTLALHDIRKFGWIRLIKKENFSDARVNKDALSISFEDFKNSLNLRKMKIKNALLNQKIVQGIGNIYSDEILWYAGIEPLRPANSLNSKKIKRIYSAMKKVLKMAIRKGGTSMRDYRKPNGKKGGYYPIRRVYQREGEKCARDGAIIKRIKIGGRSAHFCPYHQT
ncbi:MAG: Formamidopyrimidine-DNA glycosylase [Parcubacteria group bacterium GW2011_GWA2_42_14]|nr:MAG: Formamidopyrimidine-DNA glycosylase [Parcubacteria group bacterium GW2011_GWA2_42_14]